MKYALIGCGRISPNHIYVNAMEGKRALELVLAIYKSAAEGHSIRLPLKECATTDFLGRFSK